MKKIQISPSILSADFSNLEKVIKKLETSGADMIHVDVMDGRPLHQHESYLLLMFQVSL